MDHKTISLPTTAQLEAELARVLNHGHRGRKKSRREKKKEQYRYMLRSTLTIMVVAAALVVLLSHFLFPILKIYGTSMTPNLADGNIVAAVRHGDYERGDVVAFYYNDKILVKRIIGLPSEQINIDDEGNVYIDGEELDESYIEEKALGECDLKMPYQISDGRYFVIGDHRSVSSDSRNSQVGCVSEEQIIGKVVVRLWPLNDFGVIN